MNLEAKKETVTTDQKKFVFGEKFEGRRYNKLLEYQLSNNPDDVLSKYGVILRKIFNPIFRRLVPLTTKNKFHIERKGTIPKELRYTDKKGIFRKKRPIIYVATHGFRDDVALTIKAIDRHAYILYGSLLDYYYSIDGLALWLNGSIIVDRKDKKSRASSVKKMEKAIDLGANLIIFSEGVWNKSKNKIVTKLYPGVYRVAKSRNAIVVPVATILENGVAHAIVEDAFDITLYDEKEGIAILRDKLATAKYELMEKYSKIEHKDLEPVDEYWDNFLEDLISTANGLYDHEIEDCAEYKDKDEITEEEAFAPFQNVEITKENAKVLVKVKGLRK